MRIFFEIVGIITCIVLVAKLYRLVFPRKYTESSCPRDHDTIARYGQQKCDTCGTIFFEYEE
jgi:hypothetical protein